MPLTIQLKDEDGNALATAVVEPHGAQFSGVVNLRPMPPAVRQTFDDFEAVVNGQVLSLFDDIECRIAALGIVGVWEDGREVALNDLQIYPGGGTVSFKVAQKPVARVAR